VSAQDQPVPIATAKKPRRKYLPEWWPMKKEFSRKAYDSKASQMVILCSELLFVAKRLHLGDVNNALFALRQAIERIEAHKDVLRVPADAADCIEVPEYDLSELRPKIAKIAKVIPLFRPERGPYAGGPAS